MTPDQKKIFGDMLHMLSKLGLNTKDSVKESVNKFDINYDLERQMAGKANLDKMIKRHAGLNREV
jgi:hypothetical protein